MEMEINLQLQTSGDFGISKIRDDSESKACTAK